MGWGIVSTRISILNYIHTKQLFLFSIFLSSEIGYLIINHMHSIFAISFLYNFVLRMCLHPVSFLTYCLSIFLFSLSPFECQYSFSVCAHSHQLVFTICIWFPCWSPPPSSSSSSSASSYVHTQTHIHMMRIRTNWNQVCRVDRLERETSKINQLHIVKTRKTTEKIKC